MLEIRDRKYFVDRVVYYNESNKWGVLACEPDESPNEVEVNLFNSFGSITLSGNFEGVYEGAKVEVTGNVVNNPKYGNQIGIISLKVIADTTTQEGIVNFLSKSSIAGISSSNARKIYDFFGKDSIDIVLNNPDKLCEVKGIKNKTVQKIKESVAEYKRMEELIKYCTDLGISYTLIVKLDEALGDKAVSILKANPFSVLDIADNISFSQMDDIFMKNGGKLRDVNRLKAGLSFALKKTVILNGSTGCVTNFLKGKYDTVVGLNPDYDDFSSILYKLIEEKVVEQESGYVYYVPFAELEKRIGKKLAEMNCKDNNEDFLYNISEEDIENEINSFKEFKLNEQQVNAVRNCLKHRVAVLTGLGGCGKSTITKALYNICINSGYKPVLLAPTAKACRRLEECIPNSTAYTLHRYLMNQGVDVLGIDEDNIRPIEDHTVFMIDESSMLDIILLNHLLKLINDSSKILFVGDNNQLPSVQAGNVLGDLISSGVIHTSILTDVVRQRANSHIISFCADVNNGIIINPCDYDDFHYEEFGSAVEVRDKLINVYLKEVKEKTLSEVCVIAPYKKGELGMNNLNSMLQLQYQSMRQGKECFGIFREGDRVRHTQNNYRKGVFNGDTGIVLGYSDDENEMVVDFGDKIIFYDEREIGDLTLSYASTVHSCQGSEYKTVFVILDDDVPNTLLMIRRLLYTAMSRGKERVYIYAKPHALDFCVQNDSYKPRVTKLKEFLNYYSK